MKTVYRDGHGEIEVKKSRFIADLHPAASEEEAAAFISEIKKKYRDARHHCYALCVGPHRETVRSSDDGEPSGTAGRPILELICKEGLTDSVLVVTRYFGGTLLGTGGLVRAYTQAARRAVDSATIIEKKPGRELIIVIDYSILGKIQALCAAETVPITGIRYTEQVELKIIAPQAEADMITGKITEAACGTAKIYADDIKEYAIIDGKAVIFT